MAKTRVDLSDQLDELEKALPRLIECYPDDAEFWPAFAGMADVIEDAAGPDDYEWVLQRVDGLLARHGKLATDDMPPSDNLPPT